MRSVYCKLLAFAATFLTMANGIDMELVPFYKTVSEGSSVNITEHGPFAIYAACDEYAVTMNVLVEATQDDYIFSNQDDPAKLVAGDTAEYTSVFSKSSVGNDYHEGGFASASGYQLSFNGQSVIALHMDDGATQPLFGDDVRCVISGIVQLITK